MQNRRSGFTLIELLVVPRIRDSRMMKSVKAPSASFGFAQDRSLGTGRSGWQEYAHNFNRSHNPK